jgi:hypothetical protein
MKSLLEIYSFFGLRRLLTLRAIVWGLSIPLFLPNQIFGQDDHGHKVWAGIGWGMNVWRNDNSLGPPGMEATLDIRMSIGNGLAISMATGFGELRSKMTAPDDRLENELRLYPIPLSVELFWECYDHWIVVPFLHAGVETMAYDLRTGSASVAYGRSVNFPFGIEVRVPPYPVSLDFTVRLLDDLTDEKSLGGRDVLFSVKIGVHFALDGD